MPPPPASAAQASSAYNVQSELVAGLANDLRRTTSELNMLHLHVAATAGTKPLAQQLEQQLEQQLHAVRADMSAQVRLAAPCSQPQLSCLFEMHLQLRVCCTT